MATSLHQLLRLILPHQRPTLSVRSTTWSPITSGKLPPLCPPSSGIRCPRTPCPRTAHPSTDSPLTNPHLALRRQRPSTRQSSSRTTAQPCTHSDLCPQTSNRRRCRFPSQYPILPPTAPTRGSTTTTSALRASHSSSNPRTATFAPHATRPSPDQVVYAFTAIAIQARSPTSARSQVVERPSACEAT